MSDMDGNEVWQRVPGSSVKDSCEIGASANSRPRGALSQVYGLRPILVMACMPPMELTTFLNP